jgi:hypothetical protein
MGDTVLLPAGFKADARIGILVIAVLGEILQGGLFFGWNALAIMIKDLGNYSDGCPPSTPFCTSFRLLFQVPVRMPQ